MKVREQNRILSQFHERCRLGRVSRQTINLEQWQLRESIDEDFRHEANQLIQNVEIAKQGKSHITLTAAAP